MNKENILNIVNKVIDYVKVNPDIQVVQIFDTELNLVLESTDLLEIIKTLKPLKPSKFRGYFNPIGMVEGIILKIKLSRTEIMTAGLLEELLNTNLGKNHSINEIILMLEFNKHTVQDFLDS